MTKCSLNGHKPNTVCDSDDKPYGDICGINAEESIHKVLLSEHRQLGVLGINLDTLFDYFAC